MFDANSRYAGLPIYTLFDRRGRRVAVVPAAPHPDQSRVGLHRHRQGERLDHYAAIYLADATAFWRICEINDVMLPEALSEALEVAIPQEDQLMALGFQIEVTGLAEPNLPAPSQVEVHERLGEPTTFRLNYTVDIGDQEITLVSNPSLGPGAEIAVVVAVEKERHVLVKGPVHGQRIRLVHGGSPSWVEVCGSDKSIEMDRAFRREVWDGVRSSDVVRQIVTRYGFADDIEETRDEHQERKHTLVQADTDLRFVRRLARRYGYLFWVTTAPAGESTAHFRRPPLQGSPTAQLMFNRREPRKPTIATLDIAWDVERSTEVEARQLDVNTKSVIDGGVSASPLVALGARPLSSLAKGTRSSQVVAAVDGVADLAQRAEAALIQEAWFVEASCDTSLNALGRLVRAHTLVEVLGAGLVHSGKYLVAGVRHAIDANGHVMELKLCRNAWGAQ